MFEHTLNEQFYIYIFQGFFLFESSYSDMAVLVCWQVMLVGLPLWSKLKCPNNYWIDKVSQRMNPTGCVYVCHLFVRMHTHWKGIGLNRR